MTRRLLDAEHIFGIHEPGGEQYMLAAGRPGWVLFSEAVGHDPLERSGVDFSSFSGQGLGVICRVNHGYEPAGSLPHSSRYEDFARRVANFVATSRGCKIWVIGNEMNYAAERPGIVIDWTRHNTMRSGPPEMADPMRRGVDVRFNALPDRSAQIRATRGAIISPGEEITPEMYGRVYRLCRDAIHRLPGHEDDQVLVGAVAPWNTQTIYAGNANGDWVDYFRDILQLLGPDNCDGFALHAYTHGNDPAHIDSDAHFDAPFQQRHVEFHVYRDFMQAVPASMRHLAAYITEAGPVDPWEDRNSGWIQRAYADVDAWNRTPGAQQVRAMILYRWPRIDRWFIEGKQGVIEDFRQALQHDYRWRASGDGESPAPVGELLAAPPPAGQPARKSAPLPDYRVEWLDDSFPERLRAGETITATITVRNGGALTWRWGGGNPFQLAYHYYRNRRRLPLTTENDLRTDVAGDVPHGTSVTFEARIALPDDPGNYTLELDMVHEGVTRFKEAGSPVLTRWLTVEGAATNGGATTSLAPLFQDVIAQLPHSGAAYARRSLDQIRYLVINHTGANPNLHLTTLARTHIGQGYPGIAYDFVVDGRGQVYKVSQLEEVAEPGRSWSLQGVNIALAGNFNHTTPPLAQLEATGRLCAWLAQNLNLEPQSIIGLGELTRSDSPGRTFYRGANWQALLQRQVQLHLAVLRQGASDTRAAEQEESRRALAAELETVRSELAEARLAEQRAQANSEQLRLELADLRQQVRAQAERGDMRPPLRNVVDQLPRDARRYVLRAPDQIDTIVINQTGSPPETPLTRIAEQHMPDWPGILYDFCIGADGVISQTQPLDQVADTEQPHIARAINIAFAGRFDESTPTGDQLFSGAQLIAWLLGRTPQLAIDDIRGLSELTDHDSPGRQWLEGAAWKEMLLAGVRRVAGLVDPTEVENRLTAQVAELGQQLQITTRNNRTLEEQRQRLQTEMEALQSRLAATDPTARRHIVVPRPALRDITATLPRHPTLRYARRPRSRISHIAIHHTATLPTMGPRRIAELHIAADPGRGKEAWPAIGYHYFIHADGAIDQTNELEEVVWHVHRHNDYTVGIAFAGSFMNGSAPTSAQVRAGAHLCAWLMQELNIPLARIWGHRQFPDNVTVCPGSEWTGGRRWRDDLFAQIEQVQSGVGVKSIRHYLLFWQRPYPGELARRDFINAVGYVARFRPTIGFNPEDARTAEYVTVVGGEAGIPAATEAMLRAAGCKVERIAGRDEDETGRMLAELVRLNRRFRTFDVDF